MGIFLSINVEVGSRLVLRNSVAVYYILLLKRVRIFVAVEERSDVRVATTYDWQFAGVEFAVIYIVLKD